jgi:glycosyltransferase involved in cell wall biosynthesis
LIEILKNETFDIIQLETLYLAPYVNTIREYSNARIVMRAHNVEHEIWERITQNTSSHLRKMYLTYLTRKLREYEIGQFPAYDHLVTLTERDLKIFLDKGYANGASVAPIGFDADAYPNSDPEFGPQMSICFIGSMDWIPNIEGLEWFLTQCWPQIHERWPGIIFHVAGRNTPASLLELKLANVTIHGEVADASAFINSHSVMIVPLFSGSGMRVKIVEGMMMGKVIITSGIGKEGIEGKDHHHFLVADTAAQFIQAVEFCVTNPEQAFKIGQAAQENASHQFDGSRAAQKILDIYQALLGYEDRHAESTHAQPLTS